MGTTIYQVDAFADRPFAGNPAAVCLLDGPADETWMGNLAAEMNLSETAFLHPESQQPEDDGFRLRWFTPAVEVDLCGHATLATAHVLWESGVLATGTEARFHTRSGLLTARQDGEWIVLDFPATPPQAAEIPPDLLSALGLADAKFVGCSRFDYMVVVDDEKTVRELTPNFSQLRGLPVRGVMVTASAHTAGYDFVSRFFAPGSGIDEDPVTGSAHCTLTPYWADELGKTQMVGYQASARGGVVKVGLSGHRVQLGGQAVTVMVGQVRV